MLSDNKYKLVYSTGEDEPLEFFIDSLMESNLFDLGLGYFSTGAFRTLSLGFAFFISRGGRMRILINDSLSIEDKEAIVKGISNSPEEIIEGKIISNISSIYETLCKRDRHFYNCISWLIASRMLEIKAIVPISNSIGIVHQKFGLFKDNKDNEIAFTGSANFSWNALTNNIETISCYKSWIGERSEMDRVRYFDLLFNKMWDGRSLNVKFVPLENVKTYIRKNFPIETIDEILEDERQLIEDIALDSTSLAIQLKLAELKTRLTPKMLTPTFPKGYTAWDYQIQALKNWEKANFQGFFEMATGTGKTITALNCVLSRFEQEKIYRFLVVVPTLTLAAQWADEAESFNFKNIIIANSENKNWVEQCLEQINRCYSLSSSFGIITTYATFILPKFQSLINRLDESAIFIADEAHNFGSQKQISFFPNKFKRRIGLSATPERQFDYSGTKAVLGFFNADSKPTFSLDMKEAIERKFLCEYYYYPKIVNLQNDEQQQYNAISKALLRYFDSKTGKFSDSRVVQMLLLQRKRIIHKAENKKDCLRECFKEILFERHNIQYTLVYVPEGSDNTIDEFDQKIIDEYSKIISQEFNLTQHQFTGETQNRDEIISRFTEGRLSVLTAMKCLDEGIDIKRTETAVFCSSTGNPRQFIQRRGRILRRHKDKKSAFIYDMIVVPSLLSFFDSKESAMEKSILTSELKRVYEFASLAKNKYQALKTLERVANEYGIDIFSTSIA